MPIPRQAITGLILAGGRGSRMGGVDKGLQPHQGMPMAMHALLRLRCHRQQHRAGGRWRKGPTVR